MAKYQKYAEYKDSGAEWLEEVPVDWDVIKIKHLSSVKRGASPRPIDDPKFFDDNGDYAWVRIADVSASDMYLLNTTQTMSVLGSSLSVKLEPNELFLSIAGTVGKPCINKIKACIHDGFVYFPDLKIPNKYLFYIFAGEQVLGRANFGGSLTWRERRTAESIRILNAESRSLPFPRGCSPCAATRRRPSVTSRKIRASSLAAFTITLRRKKKSFRKFFGALWMACLNGLKRLLPRD